MALSLTVSLDVRNCIALVRENVPVRDTTRYATITQSFYITLGNGRIICKLLDIKCRNIGSARESVLSVRGAIYHIYMKFCANLQTQTSVVAFTLDTRHLSDSRHVSTPEPSTGV